MTQLLRAIASEQHSLALYAAFAAQYPYFAPFVNAQNAQLEALSFFARQNGITPLQESPNIGIPTTEMLALESALAHESAKIAFYDNLAASEPNLAIRDVFFQIAATCHNSHLPAIRNALAGHYANQNSLGDLLAGAWLQDAQKLVQDAQSGTLSEEKLMGFLRNLNVPMLGAVLLGGAVVALCSNLLNQNKE